MNQEYIDKIDEMIEFQENYIKTLNEEISKIEEEINDLEVEHFLTHGPGQTE